MSLEKSRASGHSHRIRAPPFARSPRVRIKIISQSFPSPRELGAVTCERWPCFMKFRYGTRFLSWFHSITEILCLQLKSIVDFSKNSGTMIPKSVRIYFAEKLRVRRAHVGQNPSEPKIPIKNMISGWFLWKIISKSIQSTKYHGFEPIFETVFHKKSCFYGIFWFGRILRHMSPTYT